MGKTTASTITNDVRSKAVGRRNIDNLKDNDRKIPLFSLVLSGYYAGGPKKRFTCVGTVDFREQHHAVRFLRIGPLIALTVFRWRDVAVRRFGSALKIHARGKDRDAERHEK